MSGSGVGDGMVSCPVIQQWLQSLTVRGVCLLLRPQSWRSERALVALLT